MTRKCGVALLSGVLTFCNVMTGQSTASQQPTTPAAATTGTQALPLDPLTAQEKRSAESIAAADPRVSKLLGTGRRQVVSVELFPIKPDAEKMAAAAAGHPIVLNRYAEILFLRYEKEAGVRAIVDLSNNQVIEARQIASDAVPLTEADLAEAAKLALADPQVSKALGAQASRFRPESSTERPTGPLAEQFVIQGLPVRGTNAKDPCWRHRCLHLLFRTGDAYLTRPAVIVDLTSRQVRVQKTRLERTPNEMSH